MVDRDIVFAKVASVEYYLKRIARAREPGRNLDSEDVEDIVVLNLQRAAQATIDLAAHVVASEGYGLPDKVAENFTFLEKTGVLEPDLAANLCKMVGFRNVVVHDYEDVDMRTVEDIVEHRLGTLREFCKKILDRFHPGSPTPPG